MEYETNTVKQVFEVVTREFIPYGQMTLYKALMDAEGEWVPKSDLAHIIRWDDEESLTGVIGALGKRVNFSKIIPPADRIGAKLLINIKSISGELHYRPTSELQNVLSVIPGLRAIFALSIEEIREKYRSSWWADNAAQRIDLGLYD